MNTDRKGRANSSYSFSGVNDVVSIPHSNATNLLTDLTISVWIQPGFVGQRSKPAVPHIPINLWDLVKLSGKLVINMRYFKDRAEAGRLLAEQMQDYARQNCAVLALGEGGILVGAEIAKAIHGSLFLLSIEDITLPRELEPLASMSNAGTFTFNHSLSHADLEEINTESRTLIDQLRLETFQKLNRIISKDGPIDKELLKRHVVIVVSDGVLNGLSIDVAADFLKPIVTKDIVVATPLCNTDVIDRIRLMTSEFFVLDMIEGGFPLSHYYEDNNLPSHDDVIQTMSEIYLNW